MILKNIKLIIYVIFKKIYSCKSYISMSSYNCKFFEEVRFSEKYNTNSFI